MERVILPLGSFRELMTDNGKEFETNCVTSSAA